MGERFRTIGQPAWRVDGIGKVTGRSRFAADLAAPGMLWGAVLLAGRPHARILSIDTSAARALPGVQAVLTASDLHHERLFGVVIRNQPVLAVDKVRQYGDGVAMVAAESQAAAELACKQIIVRYEDLPGVFDPEEAMSPGAVSIHEGSNVFVHHPVRKGNPAAGFAEAAIVLERVYTTQHVEHAAIEPEGVLAEMTEDGGVRVTGSIQNIFSTRKSLAAILGLDLARVTVKHATMGGSFGGKDEVMTQMAARAALLARATGRPVKMVNTREQSMTESYKRHPYVMRYRIGADKDGRLTAIEARIVADGGAYASMSPFVTWRSAVQATGPYECPNVQTDVYAVYTNNVYTGAMRGFGAPQVNFAIESLMDELGEAFGVDPLEIRMRNLISRGSITATGQKLDHEVSIREVLRLATEASSWARRREEIAAGAEVGEGTEVGAGASAPGAGSAALGEAASDPSAPAVRRGIGLACSYRGVSLGAEGTDAAGAIVSVQSDGSVIVTVGLTDMGQGVSSALSMIAAEVLGIDTKRIRFMNVHTGRVPDSGPTVASRSTIMGGMATKKAAEAVRAVLLDVVADEIGVATDSLVARDGRIVSMADPRLGFTFDEAVAHAYAGGRPLLGFGWHKSPQTTWNETTGQGEAYFTFVYGANVAEVEVDMETGKVDVTRVFAVHDVGRAISPAMIESQIDGGIAMGLGYAVLERYGLQDGIPEVANFDEYLIATSLDMPEVTTLLVENPDPAGPFGAKSIGEPATEIAAPAIVNAIAHATGRRVRALPADLESVLLGERLVNRRNPGAPKSTGTPGEPAGGAR
jgi:CO/xanthine dehydrogenase Mo-binding subunit